MQIDPKIGVWFQGLMTAVGLVGFGVVNFTGLLPDPIAHKIVGWCFVGWTIYGGVGTSLHLWSAPTPGPLVASTSPAPFVPKILLLPFLLCGMFAVTFACVPRAEARNIGAHAMHVVHARKFVALSLPKAKSPDQIVDAVRKWVTTDGDKDLAAAIVLAKASNNNVTLPCWTALQAFVKQIEAVPSAASLPSVHLATDIEIATDLMIALQANSPVVASCQALANYQKMNAVNMVTGIVTGALSLSALPLPALPLPLP
ncbi:MAG TPA: hypothetical protein VL492_11665 [Methylovirgula sp.]|jgi:hypothetical protein|nr:hypothetical protein [Methylovirgula sp.]